MRPPPPQVVRAAAVGVLLTLTWAILHRGVRDPLQIGDVRVYREWGEAIAGGLLPYRDFPVDYPPGALPMFWLPTLFPNYLHGVELLAWACGAGAVVLVALTLGRVAESPWRLYAGVAFAALGPLALGSVTLVRYDLWPVLLTAGALLALVTGRPRLGVVLLAVGTAAKVYPVVLLPLALVHVRRERGAREAAIALGVFAVALLVVLLPFLVAAPDQLLDAVRRQAGRDLQVESLGAGALLLAHQLGAYTPEATASLRSFSLGGSVADATASVLTALQGLAVLAVWVVYARGEGEEPRRLLLASAAAVTAFATFGKVLSPQYLLWLIPLVALVAGRTGVVAAALLGVCVLLTRDLFEVHYDDVIAFRPLSLLVTARDALLVVLYGVLLGGMRLRGDSRHANIRSPWWSASSTPASSSWRRWGTGPSS
jgi:hypothetical protein